MLKGFAYWAAAAALVSTVCLAAPASADEAFFFGHWDNVDPGTSNITRVHVEPAGGWDVKVHAWGACHPADCDWGTSVGHYEGGFGGDTVKVEFNSGFSITKLVLHQGPGDHLTYDAHTKFTDGSGRPPYDVAGEFHREGGGGYGPPPGGGYGPPPGPGGGGYGPPPGGGYGPPPGPGGYVPPPGQPPGPTLGNEDCIGFDPGAVSASFVGGDWKVVQGSMWLLDYGADAGAAHHAADVIHHYHFDQQCFVKRPNAPMMYWKTGDHIAHGNTPGEDCIGLNPMTAAVAHVGGSWKVVDGSNWLLDYGSEHGAADKALAVIQTYQLNRQCFIKRPNASMQYWLAQ
jgi:hypothetical protein